MLPFKLVYSDNYYLPIGAHVFPAEKYRLIHKHLLETGIAEAADFVTPQPASDEDILRVHTREYVQKLKTGTLSTEEEMQMEVPYSPELVKAFWLAAGGSILAADLALRQGMAVHNPRGFQHPFSRQRPSLLVDPPVGVPLQPTPPRSKAPAAHNRDPPLRQ